MNVAHDEEVVSASTNYDAFLLRQQAANHAFLNRHGRVRLMWESFKWTISGADPLVVAGTTAAFAAAAFLTVVLPPIGASLWLAIGAGILGAATGFTVGAIVWSERGPCSDWSFAERLGASILAFITMEGAILMAAPASSTLLSMLSFGGFSATIGGSARLVTAAVGGEKLSFGDYLWGVGKDFAIGVAFAGVIKVVGLGLLRLSSLGVAGRLASIGTKYPILNIAFSLSSRWSYITYAGLGAGVKTAYNGIRGDINTPGDLVTGILEGVSYGLMFRFLFGGRMSGKYWDAEVKFDGVKERVLREFTGASRLIWLSRSPSLFGHLWRTIAWAGTGAGLCYLNQGFDALRRGLNGEGWDYLGNKSLGELVTESLKYAVWATVLRYIASPTGMRYMNNLRNSLVDLGKAKFPHDIKFLGFLPLAAKDTISGSQALILIALSGWGEWHLVGPAFTFGGALWNGIFGNLESLIEGKGVGSIPLFAVEETDPNDPNGERAGYRWLALEDILISVLTSPRHGFFMKPIIHIFGFGPGAPGIFRGFPVKWNHAIFGLASWSLNMLILVPGIVTGVDRGLETVPVFIARLSGEDKKAISSFWLSSEPILGINEEHLLGPILAPFIGNGEQGILGWIVLFGFNPQLIRRYGPRDKMNDILSDPGVKPDKGNGNAEIVASYIAGELGYKVNDNIRALAREMLAGKSISADMLQIFGRSNNQGIHNRLEDILPRAQNIATALEENNVDGLVEAIGYLLRQKAGNPQVTREVKGSDLIIKVGGKIVLTISVKELTSSIISKLQEITGANDRQSRQYFARAAKEYLKTGNIDVLIEVVALKEALRSPYVSIRPDREQIRVTLERSLRDTSGEITLLSKDGKPITLSSERLGFEILFDKGEIILVVSGGKGKPRILNLGEGVKIKGGNIEGLVRILQESLESALQQKYDYLARKALDLPGVREKSRRLDNTVREEVEEARKAIEYFFGESTSQLRDAARLTDLLTEYGRLASETGILPEGTKGRLLKDAELLQRLLIEGRVTIPDVKVTTSEGKEITIDLMLQNITNPLNGSLVQRVLRGIIEGEKGEGKYESDRVEEVAREIAKRLGLDDKVASDVAQYIFEGHSRKATEKWLMELMKDRPGRIKMIHDLFSDPNIDPYRTLTLDGKTVILSPEARGLVAELIGAEYVRLNEARRLFKLFSEDKISSPYVKAQLDRLRAEIEYVEASLRGASLQGELYWLGLKRARAIERLAKEYFKEGFQSSRSVVLKLQEITGTRDQLSTEYFTRAAEEYLRTGNVDALIKVVLQIESLRSLYAYLNDGFLQPIYSEEEITRQLEKLMTDIETQSMVLRTERNEILRFIKSNPQSPLPLGEESLHAFARVVAHEAVYNNCSPEEIRQALKRAEDPNQGPIIELRGRWGKKYYVSREWFSDSIDTRVEDSALELSLTDLEKHVNELYRDGRTTLKIRSDLPILIESNSKWAREIRSIHSARVLEKEIASAWRNGKIEFITTGSTLRLEPKRGAEINELLRQTIEAFNNYRFEDMPSPQDLIIKITQGTENMSNAQKTAVIAARVLREGLESLIRTLPKDIQFSPERAQEQIRMVFGLLSEKSVSVQASGGKTYGGIMEMVVRYILNPEVNQLWVIKTGDSAQLFDRGQAKGKPVRELLDRFGLQLVDGDEFMLKRDLGGVEQLESALKDKGNIVVLSQTQLGHLRNINNEQLINALRDQDIVRIDEIHIPFSDKVTYIVGANMISLEKALSNYYKINRQAIERAWNWVNNVEKDTNRDRVLKSTKPMVYFDPVTGKWGLNEGAIGALERAGIDRSVAYACFEARFSQRGDRYTVIDGKITPMERGEAQKDRVISDPAHLAALALKEKDADWDKLYITETSAQATLSEVLRFSR